MTRIDVGTTGAGGLQGEPIYLDWNATSPAHPSVIEAMAAAAAGTWGNAASVHAWGRRSKHLVETVREQLASCLGAHPRDLVFTSGGTEANNWALHDAPGLVLTRLEHPSVAKLAERLSGAGRAVRWIPVTPNGQIEPDAVREGLRGMPESSVVAAMAVNHETGIIQPIQAIAEVVHAAGAYLHVDAVQALGKLPSSAWMGWDSVSVAAHKIRGPKGIGALAWRTPRPVPGPLLTGGGQERGLRPGTVDSVAIAGFGAALARLENYTAAHAPLGALRDRIEASLADILVPNVAPDIPRLHHVTSLFARGWLAEELVAAMDLEGVCISAGSACAAGTAEISPVIQSVWGTERARSTVRVSLGELTDELDVTIGIEAFRRVLTRR